MKNFLPVILIIFLFTGCKKRFPDGPLISFRSLNTRVSGYWELENYIVDGVDSAEIINNILGAKCEINFYSFGTETEPVPYTIQWGNDTSNYFYSSWESGSYQYIAQKNKVSLLLGALHDSHGSPYFISANLFLVFQDTIDTARHYQILKCTTDKLWLKAISHNKTYELHLTHKK